MADKILFKLDLNLQKLAINAIAIKLWESPLARQKVREFFKEHWNYRKLTDFDPISDLVLQQLQDIRLPGKLLAKIRDVIPFIGEKLFYWTRRAIFNLGLKLDHAEKMAWTCYGTVDENKTFQLYWQNDPELLQTGKDFKHSLYTIACLFGQEEFVTRNLSVMKKLLRDFSGPQVKMPEIRDAQSMISCWLHRYFKEKRELQNYENLEPVLIRICADEGYFNAVKYFWNNLQKGGISDFLENVQEVLSVIFEQYTHRLKEQDSFQILFFLFRKMSSKFINQFLIDNVHKSFVQLIDFWPYNELTLQIINYTLPLVTEDEHEQLLISLVDYCIDQKGKHPTFLNISRQALGKALELTSKQIKKKTLIDDRDTFSFIVQDIDFETVKMIFSDPDLIEYKDEVIERVLDEFLYSIIRNKFDFDRLNNLMPIVLSENDRKKFEWEFYNCLKKLVEKEDFDSSNKLLNWLADSNEEKRQIKKEIKPLYNFNILKDLLKVEMFEKVDAIINWLVDESDEEKFLLRKELKPIEVLTYFHDRKKFSFSTWAELLNWQFDGDEEQIKSAKIAFRTNDFIRSLFYKLWCGYCVFSVDLARTKCSEFLNFFFEPDEIENCKRKIIISDESFIKIFCGELLIKRNFDTVNELLKFCCVPENIVKEMKGKLLKDLEKLIYYFARQEKRFEVAFTLTNWVLNGKENKDEIVKNFVNSLACEELCLEMIKNFKLFCPDDVIMLFNLWIKPYGDFSKLRAHGLAVSENTNCPIYKLKYLLMKLEKEGYVSRYDFELKQGSNLVPKTLLLSPAM